MNQDAPHSRSDFWNERAKHQRFETLANLVEADPNKKEIIAASGLTLVTGPQYGRQFIDSTTRTPVWTETIRFGISVEAYERLRTTYISLRAPEGCSKK